jgi:hypothetical protein
MEKNKITITTIPVTIKVMEVGGKKLTLSVFKQIPSSGFDENNDDSFLGWVKHDIGKFILFHRDGVLLKHGIHPSNDDLVKRFSYYLTNENQIYIAI